MVEIIGNNIGTLLNSRMSRAADPDVQRKKDEEALEKHIPRNRLSGLIRGSYGINLREVVIVKEVFELDRCDDVIITRRADGVS